MLAADFYDVRHENKSARNAHKKSVKPRRAGTFELYAKKGS